jgi:segregation and condensation protein B
MTKDSELMDQDSSINQELSLGAKIEALLFVAPGTVSINQLATVLEQTPTKIEEALEELENQYNNRGIRLQNHRGRLQLVSAPQSASLIKHYLGLEATSRISQAALETMAIIAYQQPVTRPEVDAIRGVNSDGVIKTLLSRGLIEEVGRGTGPGRPILYSTTPEFLGYFGLTSIADLPPLKLDLNVNQNDPSNNDILKD